MEFKTDSYQAIDAKAIEDIGDNEIHQLGVGLVINFKNSKLEWKRVVRERFAAL